MFCTRCGKEFEDDNLFCPFCGAKVEVVDDEIEDLSSDETIEEDFLEREEPPKKESGSSKKTVLIIAIIAVVLIGAAVGGYFFYQFHQSVKINLCELMTEPTFEGDNGSAAIENSVVVDEDKAEEVINQIKNEDKQVQVRNFLTTVAYTASPSDNLKNGDKVKIIATYNEDLVDVLKLDLTGRETTVTVKGLKKGKTASDIAPDRSKQHDWTAYGYDFIFPYSSDEYIDEDILTDYSADDIQWAINEIYARHGYTFDLEPYQSYFAGCEWYTPMYTRDQFKSSWLNTYEEHNIKLLSKYR